MVHGILNYQHYQTNSLYEQNLQCKIYFNSKLEKITGYVYREEPLTMSDIVEIKRK